MKDHETQGRGLFISALGYFAFLQSRGIWGLLCRLAVSCASPTVSRDSSRDRVCGWEFVGSQLTSEPHGKEKRYKSKKKAFSDQDNDHPHLCLPLGSESCFCLSLCLSLLPPISFLRSPLATSLFLCRLFLLTTHQTLPWKSTQSSKSNCQSSPLHLFPNSKSLSRSESDLTREDYVSGPNPWTGDWLRWGHKRRGFSKKPARIGGSDLCGGYGEMLAEYYTYL